MRQIVVVLNSFSKAAPLTYSTIWKNACGLLPDAWQFEEAAHLRDRIAALTQMRHQRAIETTGGDVDADIVAASIGQGIVL